VIAGIAIGVGLVLLLVPGLLLLTIWALIAPVIVVERTGAMESFGRSRALVLGNGWQVFTVIAMVLVIRFALAFVASALAGISDTFAAYAIADLLTSILVAPIAALAAAVMYFALRAIREAAAPAG
jgi:hypothetical protein